MSSASRLDSFFSSLVATVVECNTKRPPGPGRVLAPSQQVPPELGGQDPAVLFLQPVDGPYLDYAQLPPLDPEPRIAQFTSE